MRRDEEEAAEEEEQQRANASAAASFTAAAVAASFNATPRDVWPPPPVDDAPAGAARPLGSFSVIVLRDPGRMRKVRERILSPSDFNVKLPPKPKEVRRRFADEAKKHSEHESAREGGELGELGSGEGVLDSEPVEGAARALQVGDVSAVIASEVGVLHLLYRSG